MTVMHITDWLPHTETLAEISRGFPESLGEMPPY